MMKAQFHNLWLSAAAVCLWLSPNPLRAQGPANHQFVVEPIAPHLDEKAFGATFFGTEVVFASYPPSDNLLSKGSSPYLDLYVASTDADGLLDQIRPFSNTLNKNLNEGPVCFNQKGDYLILTTNDYENRSADNFKKLQLVESHLRNGQWSEPTPLPFNNKDYSVAHACLSADEQTLYFVSDMPGGLGGTDLYQVHRSNNTWGTPQNLGPTVNTSGDEMFPFVHANGQLFFSSDGHGGLGGLDVYVAECLPGQQPSQARWLGEPVNGPRDDFAFVLDPTERFGYLSSNRKGKDALYRFQMVEPIRFERPLVGRITTPAGEAVVGATVVVRDAMGQELYTARTDAHGYYQIAIALRHTELKIESHCDKYLPAQAQVTVPNEAETLSADIVLREDPCNFLLDQRSPVFAVHFDFDQITTEETQALDSLSNCLRTNPKLKIRLDGHTDTRGSNRYNYMLGTGRVGFVKDYLLEKGVAPSQLNGKSHGEDKPVVKEDPNDKNYRKKYRKNRRVELRLVRD